MVICQKKNHQSFRIWCSIWTIVIFYLVGTRDARWYVGKNAMVRWWKHDSTMMKMRWYDGEIAMAR
jgi:hypothetical protein